MNDRISASPRTAMELAFNRAVQKHATKRSPPPSNKNHDCKMYGNSQGRCAACGAKV